MDMNVKEQVRQLRAIVKTPVSKERSHALMRKTAEHMGIKMPEESAEPPAAAAAIPPLRGASMRRELARMGVKTAR